MRGKRAKRRSLKLDRKYSNPIIARFISKVMQDGKKSLAEDLVYAAIEKGSKIAKEEDVVSFVNKAIDNVRPALEIKARRVGGANFTRYLCQYHQEARDIGSKMDCRGLKEKDRKVF